MLKFAKKYLISSPVFVKGIHLSPEMQVILGLDWFGDLNPWFFWINGNPNHKFVG